MSLIRCLQLLSLGLAIGVCTCGGTVPPCRPNWFGSPCRYKCRCVNNKCDRNGECTESSQCENGWFGPSCQYVDLSSTNATASTPAWVYDFPDTLCNPGQETVTVSLNDTFYFTWLRLRATAIESSQDFKLQLMSANGSPVECSKMYSSKASYTILDIHCQPGVFFRELIITGSGVRSLCSVYISGGRNVALGQNTAQSSDFYSYYSSLAVDGNRDPDFEHGSCTSTSSDHKPTWSLSFDWPHQVNRYVLYNRDSRQHRLQGFILEADQGNRSVAFIYTETTHTNQDIYRVQSSDPQIPVSNVTILCTSLNDLYLTLCEVEMFGDTVCPKGKYGRECEYRCNCAMEGENCSVSTGGCPSGCAAGYQGEGCQNPVLLDDGQDKLSPLLTAIVGPVVAFVVLVTLIVVGMLIWRRHRHKTDYHDQTNRRILQNFSETDSTRTVESNSETTTPGKAVNGQAKLSVMKKANDTQDNTDIHQHPASYYNVVPRLSESLGIFKVDDIPVVENRSKKQEIFNTGRKQKASHKHELHSSNNEPLEYINNRRCEPCNQVSETSSAISGHALNPLCAVNWDGSLRSTGFGHMMLHSSSRRRQSCKTYSGDIQFVDTGRELFGAYLIYTAPTSTHSATGEATRSEHPNIDGYTYISLYDGYEVPLESIAVMQRSKELNSADATSYVDDAHNPYESVDDKVPNDYLDILDT